MRVLVIPALAAGLLSSTLAFAAQTADGSIKSLDKSEHSLTLDNGTTYRLAKSVKETGLKVGEKVQVTWDMKNGKHEATRVTMLK